MWVLFFLYGPLSSCLILRYLPSLSLFPHNVENEPSWWLKYRCGKICLDNQKKIAAERVSCEPQLIITIYWIWCASPVTFRAKDLTREQCHRTWKKKIEFKGCILLLFTRSFTFSLNKKISTFFDGKVLLKRVTKKTYFATELTCVITWKSILQYKFMYDFHFFFCFVRHAWMHRNIYVQS